MINGAGDQRERVINPGLASALKRGHADLVALKASPFTAAKDLVHATSPATQHDRQICRLALMAPELQRQILTGDQPAGLALRQVLKSPMPLAWADQKAWLEAVSRR